MWAFQIQISNLDGMQIDRDTYISMPFLHWGVRKLLLAEISRNFSVQAIPYRALAAQALQAKHSRYTALKAEAKDFPTSQLRPDLQSSPVLQPRIEALLVDAAGTLISPSEPVAEVYQRFARPFGCTLSQDQILRNFRRAFNEPWRENALSYLRYDGEARDFWLYSYFGSAKAWTVSQGAVEALQRLQASGMKLAVVSNFDTRLRAILRDLDLLRLFDSVVISAEVKVEKPNPAIFELACSQLGVSVAQALVLGDDRRNDISGGRDAGCYAWLYGIDVLTFEEAAQKLLDNQLY